MERSTVMMKDSSSTSTSTPSNNISFPHKTTMRDASFNSYLIRPENQADDSEISIFDAQKYFDESTHVVDAGKVLMSKRVSPLNAINNNNNKNKNNPELVLFEQRRRSSGDVSAAALPRFSSASSSLDGYGRNYRARSFNATPTASSEASWNSQTGLLSNPPGAIGVSMTTRDKKKGSSSSSLAASSCSGKWLFGRNLKCPCSGKKSVQVEEKLTSISELRTPSHLYNKKLQTQTHKPLEIISMEEKCFPSDSEIIPSMSTRRISAENRFPSLIASGRPYNTGFTFPVLNQTPSALPSNTNPSLEDTPRESLEIFQPPSDGITASSRRTSSTELNLHNMMLLVSRQGFTFPASPPSRTRVTSITDDDVASDASSDLFEIESFSTCNNHNHYRRDSLDEASSFNARRLGYCTPSTRASLDEIPGTTMTTPSSIAAAAAECYCYEPSEASIEWSVTTAEGFERGSMTNFSGAASEGDGVRINGGGNNKKKVSGGGGGMLLSCRCEKAVSVVGPNTVKSVAGSGTKHVSSRAGNVSGTSNNKPPLA